jgi:hypothetical protein
MFKGSYKSIHGSVAANVNPPLKFKLPPKFVREVQEFHLAGLV